MHNWLFLTFYLAVTACGLCYCVVMLFSPVRAIRFENWVARAERYSQPNPNWKPGLLLQRRIAGLVGVFILAVMMEPAIEALARHGAIYPAPEQSAGMKVQAKWYPTVAGLVLVLGGLYIVVNPRQLVRWIQGTRPELLVAQGAVLRSLSLLRVMGALIALVGVLAMASGLSRLR